MLSSILIFINRLKICEYDISLMKRWKTRSRYLSFREFTVHFVLDCREVGAFVRIIVGIQCNIYYRRESRQTNESNMYEIKPILDQRQIVDDLPTCMYKMKTIYDNSPVHASDALTNGVVSQYSFIQPSDISQQIRNILKVFTPITATTSIASSERC